MNQSAEALTIRMNSKDAIVNLRLKGCMFLSQEEPYNAALQLRRAEEFKREEKGLLEKDTTAPSAASAC